MNYSKKFSGLCGVVLIIGSLVAVPRVFGSTEVCKVEERKKKIQDEIEFLEKQIKISQEALVEYKKLLAKAESEFGKNMAQRNITRTEGEIEAFNKTIQELKAKLQGDLCKEETPAARAMREIQNEIDHMESQKKYSQEALESYKKLLAEAESDFGREMARKNIGRTEGEIATFNNLIKQLNAKLHELQAKH